MNVSKAPLASQESCAVSSSKLPKHISSVKHRKNTQEEIKVLAEQKGQNPEEQETRQTSRGIITITMRASSLLSSLLLLPAALASAAAAAADTQEPLSPIAAETTHKISIWTQPLIQVANLARHEKLAQIVYTYPSLNTTVNDYALPAFAAPEIPGGPALLADDEVVKLGFYSGKIGDEETWHGIATAAGSFKADKKKTLKLHLDAKGEVWHVSFTSVPKVVEPVAKGKKAAAVEEVKHEGDTLHVELLPVNRGAEPHLNKPVVVNKDGKPDVPEEEPKSFLQK